MCPWWEKVAMMDRIRVSSGTAPLLGLAEWKIDVKPTTLYFMVGEKCTGKCAYCTQGKDFLSRVRWPSFPVENATSNLEGKAGRICIQSLYYNGVVEDIIEAVKKMNTSIPVSVSMNPTSRENMERLKEAGVERVGIGIDCCTEELFNRWKKNVPPWNEYLDGLRTAKSVFGNATAHIIIGLGESDEDAVRIMRDMYRQGIEVALFSYTPLRGGEPPEMGRYRAMQIARCLIKKGKGSFEFEDGKMKELHIDGYDICREAFLTSGCPSCNRPFYNERVGGPIYNYPRKMSDEEFKKEINEVKKYVRICTSSP